MNALKRKRGLIGLAMIGAGGLLLAGCAAPPADPDGPDEVDFLACAVSDEASWSDKSFNEAAYEGLLKAEDELGVQIRDAESNSVEDFEPNLTAMVDAGCDVIFAVGFNFSPIAGGPIFSFADANPESRLVWIDGWNEGQANVKPIAYNMAESSFLAGYLAAAYSTTKVVGTYGGLQIDSVTVFMTGYYNGAKYYEQETGTPVTVVGWDPATSTGDFVGGFEDTGVAKSISEAQIAANADVIFPVAGGLFTATAEAIRDSGKPIVMLGVDKDIALTQPDLADITLTSVEKRMTQAVFDVIQDLVDGGEFTNEAYLGTLANDGTALSEFYEFDDDISADLTAKLDELKAAIIAGDIDPLVTP